MRMKILKLDGRKLNCRNWRQKANIVGGNAKCETGGESLSADIHLVIYELAKHVTSLQLSRFIEDEGLKIWSYDLLTKYEGPHSVSFKITIRSSEYEKGDKPRNVACWSWCLTVQIL